MSLRRIKHTFLRLTAEERVIGVGALAMLVGTFLPWYSVTMNFDNESLTETGFSGDLGVIGFVIFIMSLISLLVLVAENMRLPIPQFGYKREQILFFFLGEAFFLTLLSMAVYTKKSLGFTEAGLRFGVYVVLLGALFGALAAYAMIQKQRKQEVREFFSHEREEEEDKKEEESVEMRAEEELVQRHPEPMYFEADAAAMETTQEEDTIEDIEETTKDDDQGDYFAREAGIDKGEEPKSKGSMSMEFYEDK